MEVFVCKPVIAQVRQNATFTNGPLWIGCVTEFLALHEQEPNFVTIVNLFKGHHADQT